MEIKTLNGTAIKNKTVAAIGFFDGVHIAHQALIKKTIEIGKQKKLQTAIITFDQHPKSILYDFDYHYITPLKRKLDIFKNFDVDTIYVINFTKEKAKLSPNDFIAHYLTNIDTLICGFDFKFGVRGSGSIDTLKAHHEFETIVMDEITFQGFKIGSTHIRDLIDSGHVAQIEAILGDYYMIEGEVIHGQKKGRMIGYPTANINTDHYLIPKQGVYATQTKVKNTWYDSMSSVGHNPTLNCRVDLSVESHIFNFDQDIYGEDITIKFIKRLRDEEKFDSIKALVHRIDQDKTATLELFEKKRR
ncbi:MAG: bifunctional riboflavin kinase/FAD synthetase [Candidatus Izimaplasma sp.]|nr:bifunctional riboflavin kinase/FAD synthetase [Candidatus Izimaplasma bacterium]